ncbi:galactosyltransferase-related protein [Streptomyces sp. NPDC050636]|uniref:galactosyltransferase-related protein n=1 Tax=Streptomyces sp. NPDC050636 TaxID=3154510 RepID=UPI0034198DD8
MSVIIPLYGDHHGRRFLPAVTAAWLAQDVPCEVVVATAGDIPVTVAESLDADRRVRVVRAAAEARAPGLLRNAGAAQAHSPLLYLSDADLAPLGRDYLTRALALARGRVLGQPWMHRLLGGPQALAGQPAVDQVVDPTAAPVMAGESPFCFVRPGPDGCLRPYPDERIHWQPPGDSALGIVTPDIWPPTAAIDPALNEHYQWRTPFHWGSLLLARTLFLEVGGYCEAYYGWGAEDDDLLVKVSSVTPTVRAWQLDRSLSCLHFEHPARYFGTSEQLANHALHTARLAAGSAAMIAQDRAAADGVPWPLSPGEPSSA